MPTDENDFLKKVTERVKDHLSYVDAEFRYLYVNPAYGLATQKDTSELVGKTVPEVLGEQPFLSLVKPKLERALLGEQVHYQDWFHFKGYIKPVYMDVLYTPDIDRDGKVHGVIASARDITCHKIQQEHLKELATLDSLTKIMNRRAILERAEQALSTAQRHDEQFALLYCDLNNFKDINDTYGHIVGDKLLKEVAGRLTQIIRREDAVGRLGGDEFVILAENIHYPSAVASIASHVEDKMEEPFRLGDLELPISISIGAALYPDDGTSLEELLSNADSLMYVEKRRMSRFAQLKESS